MKNLIVFTKKEEQIISQLKAILKSNNRSEEIQTVVNNEKALIELAESISLYPSIMSKQNLMGISRTVDTLINNLCIHEIPDKIFHMPTKAILGQGFSIAKINFFLMLHYLAGEIPDLVKNTESIFNIIENNVFTIMAEDVFISLISDKNISLEIRANAGYRLANIWEFRIYKGINEFVPILNNIWHAREKLKPAYGTMIGISELFRLTQNSDSIWLAFLQKDDISQDEVESLQEFLMELSYEEMNLISEYMVNPVAFTKLLSLN